MLPFFIQWSRPSCEDGFGHPIMLAGQGPRTIGHRDDLVQPPQFTDKGDRVQISEVNREMFTCSTGISRVLATGIEGGHVGTRQIPSLFTGVLALGMGHSSPMIQTCHLHMAEKHHES